MLRMTEKRLDNPPNTALATNHLGCQSRSLVATSNAGGAVQGISISAVRIERTAHPVPRGGVSADQRRYVVRDRIELSTFRFSGQPRQALCGPAKTDVTDKRNRARRKVQDNANRGKCAPSTRQDSNPALF